MYQNVQENVDKKEESQKAESGSKLKLKSQEDSENELDDIIGQGEQPKGGAKEVDGVKIFDMKKENKDDKYNLKDLNEKEDEEEFKYYGEEEENVEAEKESELNEEEEFKIKPEEEPLELTVSPFHGTTLELVKIEDLHLGWRV